ncbi:hypothetical protein Bca52824_019319 [Brassica carinata]|uniref:Uncharacterized protein n=1 Tax=Brassica carinata TaxID=52824 RepID=A0A8X8B0A3_BRACI|nr:hypothetical protein Bca52824_019319 [Brassica carinata]
MLDADRSKPTESTPEPEQEPEVAAPKKRLQFKTSTDASEEQEVEAMRKITSHINNPSKFSKASELAVRLIQAGRVKPETSSHFIAMLEAAMKMTRNKQLLLKDSVDGQRIENLAEADWRSRGC